MIPRRHRQIIGVGCLILIVGMAFHAFLAIWVGHLFGNQALWQSWKEILIVLLALVALDAVRRKPDAIKQLLTPSNGYILAFAVVSAVVTLIANPPMVPAWFGLKTNFEFLAAFMLASLATSKSLTSRATALLLGSSGIVAALAILQATVIPPNSLTAFGYGPQTILPLQTLGNGLTRAFATLGGPNQLGSWLILPIALSAKLWLDRMRWTLGLLIALQFIALYFTYSRSAWLGTAAAIILILWWNLNSKHRWLLVVATTLLGIGTALIIANSSNQILERPEVSDAAHAESLQTGLASLMSNPLGQGLGSAGPASFRGESAVIPENHYLQIALETGVLGLLLFVAVQIALAARLWGVRLLSKTAEPLLATLAGIAVVNLFLHGWADSSTALTFWTLAGLTIGANHHE